MRRQSSLRPPLRFLLWMGVLVGLLSTVAPLRADAIPYANVGTQAPVNLFTATNTGPVWAYFYGSDAAYNSEIGLLVENVSTHTVGLLNHISFVGQSLDLGSAAAGDTLVFQLVVITTCDTWYSDPSLNSDDLNHTYATDFTGSGKTPVGTYIAFEDYRGGGDLDYNDYQFVATNVTRNAVPEPAALGLLIAGLATVAIEKRRARRAQA